MLLFRSILSHITMRYSVQFHNFHMKLFLFGAERVESERIRLANEGQPLRVRPVGVTHSANMADPEKWVNPLR